MVSGIEYPTLIPCSWRTRYGYGEVIPQTQAMVERIGLSGRWFWVGLDARSAEIVLGLPRTPSGAARCPLIILLDNRTHPVASGGSTKTKVEYGKYHVASALVDAKLDFLFFEMDLFFLRSPLPIW